MVEETWPRMGLGILCCSRWPHWYFGMRYATCALNHIFWKTQDSTYRWKRWPELNRVNSELVIQSFVHRIESHIYIYTSLGTVAKVLLRRNTSHFTQIKHNVGFASHSSSVSPFKSTTPLLIYWGAKGYLREWQEFKCFSDFSRERCEGFFYRNL